MAEALEACGARVELVLVKHAMHGFESFGGEAEPSKEEILEQTIEFFEDQLK
jgi:acetyl esterase/lipase